MKKQFAFGKLLAAALLAGAPALVLAGPGCDASGEATSCTSAKAKEASACTTTKEVASKDACHEAAASACTQAKAMEVVWGFVDATGNPVKPTPEQVAAIQKAALEVMATPVNLVPMVPADKTDLAKGFVPFKPTAAAGLRPAFDEAALAELSKRLTAQQIQDLQMGGPIVPANWRSHEGLTETVLPDGSVRLNTNGRFRSFSVPVIGPDGKASSTCITTVAELEKVVGPVQVTTQEASE